MRNLARKQENRKIKLKLFEDMSLDEKNNHSNFFHLFKTKKLKSISFLFTFPYISDN